jgi:hypothetical protein
LSQRRGTLKYESKNFSFNQIPTADFGKTGKFNELQGPSFAYPFINFEVNNSNEVETNQVPITTNKPFDYKKTWALISKSVLGDINGMPIKDMVLKRIQLDQGL